MFPYIFEFFTCFIGDHVRVFNSIYNHHMLVTEVIDETHLIVIHYSGDMDDSVVDGLPDKTNKAGECVKVVAAGMSSTDYGSAEIIESVVEITQKIELLHYLDDEDVFTPQQAIKRARSRLKERKYNVFNNNCECLINWAYTGKDVSGQVDKAMDVGAVFGASLVAAGTAAAIGYGAYKLFGALSGQNKKSEDSD